MNKKIFAEAGGSAQQVGGTCPDGWVEMNEQRPSPQHIAQEDGAWALPDPDFLAAIADRRYQAETSGTTVDGMPINTERDSQALLTAAALQATLSPSYTVRWKTEGGFVDLDAQQVIGLASAVRAHVQACFDREAELVAAVEDDSYIDSMLDEGWPVEP